MPTLTPSMSRWGSDLTPVCHYYVSYDRQGEQTARAYSDAILTWQEEGAFLKGGGKGKGKAFPNSPHPNQRQGKGKKGKGKGQGQGAQGQRQRRRADEGQRQGQYQQGRQEQGHLSLTA